MVRVITYIDGFNLYHGLREKYRRKYLWLDVEQLSSILLKPYQTLEAVYYFTSRIDFPPDKHKRQNTYLEALQTLRSVSIVYGKYQSNTQVCRKCGFQDHIPSEKMTDVNIATQLLSDAFEDRFDVAILISGDSDLTGPLHKLSSVFSKKKVVVAFPPARRSHELELAAHASFMIGRAVIAKSLLPDPVISKSGYPLTKPVSWG